MDSKGNENVAKTSAGDIKKRKQLLKTLLDALLELQSEDSEEIAASPQGT